MSSGLARIQPPAWVERLVDPAAPTSTRVGAGWELSARGEADWRLVRVVAPGVRALPGDELAARSAAVYRALHADLAADSWYPLRCWNGVPDLLAREESENRYMHFNAGRWAACREWLAEEELPTATAVGQREDALELWCLAGRRAGRAIENPRQIAAYRYSQRYGRRPPCFARATLIEGPAPLLLIGGTASVVGEDSRHPDDLRSQLHETLRNLDALLAAAGTFGRSDLAEVRVYHPRPADQAALAAGLVAAGITAASEWCCTDLCRDDLLLEIEGVAGSLPG